MKFVKQLETPCIVVDLEKVRNNIETMQRAVEACGCRLRPHIKTHKSVEIAKMQIAAGACGITCAKVSEAEIMADGGIEDIFIAYPLVSDHKLDRALKLHSRVERLILAVDSLAGAQIMNQKAEERGIVLEVRMEIDTGSKRTGVLQKDAEALGRAIAEMENLELTGIYTFKSLMYKGEATMDAELAGQEEGELMQKLVQMLRNAGADIRDISAGSTPTGLTCAKTGLVNEVRPGTYVYYDDMTMKEGACTQADIAAHIYAAVVSVPDDSYAVLDGGTKTFPADVVLRESPFYFEGYASVTDREDLLLNRMNEEHGILTSSKGVVNLQVGDILSLVPAHICTSVNLQNEVYFLENGTVRKVPVDARGALV